ncbi:MAG TPA: hypothetical protein VI612_02460 [Candidatus Nanoarchaeia archaeon]|nr:hypothetical protein [Candidatus Nanoarchaeia archaeon]
MAQQSLIEYIQKLLKQGYDIEAIRSTLLQAGYAPYEVDTAIRIAAKPSRAIPTKMLMIAFVILLVFSLGVIMLIKILQAPPVVLSLKITALSTQTAPGENLILTAEIQNPSGRKTNALLDYTLAGPGGRITAPTESITVTTKTNVPSNIPIPKDAQPGSYTLTAVLSYQDKTATQRLNIEVTTEPTKAPEVLKKEVEEEAREIQQACPGGCDDLNFCTTDTCAQGTCQHTTITPCCGNNVCEPGEDESSCPIDCGKAVNPEEITKQAEGENTQDAISLCNTLGQRTYIDSCLSRVAETKNDQTICDGIVDTEIRDSCYIHFSYNNDFSVCPKITNPYLKSSCNTLAGLGQYQTES